MMGRGTIVSLGRFERGGRDVRLELEYPALYARFADLIWRREMEVDLAPLALVEQAFTEGRMIAVEAFEEAR